VNPSAATAAASAFLTHRASSVSLSSAAAAAALRSRPTTPTSVADVQTKRTMRRSDSNSSKGSAADRSRNSTPKPAMERRGSSGSLSERSLREPSPNRGSIRGQAHDAPPVPAIPKTIPSKAHRRAASLEAPAMRVASPPPNTANGRGSSLGPAETPRSPRRAGQRLSHLSSVQELTDAERPESRGSVNFSYPRSARAMSPGGNGRLTSPSPSRFSQRRVTIQNDAGLVYDPNTRSFLPAAEVYAIEQSIRDAAEQPVKKKKKNVVPKGVTAGSHLASGTVGGRPKGSAVDAMAAPKQASDASDPAQAAEPEEQPTQQNIQPATQPQTKKKRVSISKSGIQPSAAVPTASSYDSDHSEDPQVFNTNAAALLAKKPSVVQEDREREEQEDQARYVPTPSSVLGKLDTESNASLSTISPSPKPLPRSKASTVGGRGKALASAAFAQDRQATRSASQPPPSPLQNPLVNEAVNAPALGRGKGSVRGTRVQSVSPARTTRFSLTPESASTLAVRHQPPPRSLSPRKSAMKHSPSPRGPSPIGGVPGEYSNTYATSETSDVSTAPDDRAPQKKKKKARVSFDDDHTVVVGLAAEPVFTDSPVAPSPQNKEKRGWFSMGRGKKKDIAVPEEDAETMKPRPALPSFGSVRDKKHRETDAEPERPLVIPSEPVELSKGTDNIPSPPLFTSPTGDILENPLGISRDHVVGTVLAQDQNTKNAANISKSREPLPPDVTSVEGSGYNSDSGSDYSDRDDLSGGVTRQSGRKEGPTDGAVEQYRALASPEPTHENGNGKVPEISLQQATPVMENEPQWPSIPGGFPASSSDSSSQNNDDITQSVERHEFTPTTSAVSDVRPGTSSADAETLHHEPAILEEEEVSEADSIYSDAAETPGELEEGDGYLSLDAVASSPIVETGTGIAISTPPDSPTVKSAKQRAYRKSLGRKNSEPDIDEGWEKAQQYWKGLTDEKKRALELAARQGVDTNESSDEEDEETLPPPKAKKVVAQAVQGRREPVRGRDRTYGIQPGSRAGPNGVPVMRSSMRAEQPNNVEKTHMRQSMRSNGPANGGSMRGSMRNSMRNANDLPQQPRGALQKKPRPTSYQGPAEPTSPNKHSRNASAGAITASPAAVRQAQLMAAQLTRPGSAGSDSSFKRAKQNGNVSLRGSMRGSSAQPTNQRPPSRDESQTRSSRFSIRSLSPSGSAFSRPFTSAGPPPVSMLGGSTKASKRSASPSSLRGRQGGRFSFGSKPKAAPSKASRPKIASRFVDSSDEEDARPARFFRSRFDDSSEDDDDPAPLPSRTRMTSLRPIPPKTGASDGDSTDLPDSDDEVPQPAPEVARPSASTQEAAHTPTSLRRAGSGRDLSSGISDALLNVDRPSNKRRGSFMSILRRKKDPESKVRKSGAESPARRDTPLERSPAELAGVRKNSNSGPTSPRLQKRNGPRRTGSDSWPLPAPPIINGESTDRPATADDAISGNTRVELGTRRLTATGISTVDIENAVNTPTKKKRFPKLRKALGLHD
jgi:serine/arginine repetitive matrix protein 2